MPEEQIKAALEQAEEFRDDDDAGEVVVWSENWTTVEVFTRCQWQVTTVAGMSGAVRVWEGIPAVEIKATCELLDVPRSQWPDVLAGVGVMQATAKPVLNEQ